MEFRQLIRLLWLLATINCGLAVKIALLIIDVQNCFLPQGSLSVPDGDAVIPVINQIRSKYQKDFSLVVLSQDWHCADHISFASQHSNKSAYDTTLLQYDQQGDICGDSTCDVTYNVTQVLWPDHCVINSSSAEFSSELERSPNDVVVRKGYHCEVDSYSAFFSTIRIDKTELDSLLKAQDVDTVFIMGLATDYCVYYTATDAVYLGYTTYMVEDASRGVSPVSTTAALTDMRNKGVNIIQSRDMERIMSDLTSKASGLTTSFVAIKSGVFLFLLKRVLL